MITADLPNPPKPPMVACGNCGSMNEPDRSSCRNCGQSMSLAYGSPEYLSARKAAIARIVADAPPPTAEQIVRLRRIFSGTVSSRKEAA